MRYFQRSVKYMLALGVAYYMALVMMWRLGLSLLTPQQSVDLMLNSQRGLFMFIAMVALSAAYPLLGFMRKKTFGSIAKNRDAIIEVMAQHNFKLVSESEGKMRFIGANLMKRLGMLFEDHIVITQASDERIEISGNRKAIARILFRLEVAVDNATE